MKKILSLVLVAVMVLSIVPMAQAKTRLKVGVCINQFTNNFMTLYREELQKYLEETYDAEVTVVDGKNDQTEQTNQVSALIDAGVNVLIVNLVQATAASVIIAMAKDARVPVIFINREPSEEDMKEYEQRCCYVGADARQSGTLQGQILLNRADKGDINHSGTVEYVMITGDTENIDARYRTEYSIKALTDAGVSVKNLFEQRGDWMQEKAQELAASALSQFGYEIDVILCNNDAMALGAYQAIQEAGRNVNEDILLVGVDGLDECVEMVKNGEMTGTVFNDHISQSHLAADCALQAALGVPLERYYMADYVMITQ